MTGRQFSRTRTATDISSARPRSLFRQMGRDAVYTLERQTARYIREYRMLEDCSGIVAGVSGGADSVCLLRVLLSLREQGAVPGIPVYVVHVNHGLRDAAAQDEEFVRSLCREWNVPFSAVHADVTGFAEEAGIGSEEAGRILRMRAFEDAAKKMPGARIALAHHLEDSAETLLFNLSRGSRLAGMAGIRPVRGNVIHPLIGASRGEIEAYLKEQGTGWRTDESNAEDRYTRNIIRNTVIPLLESKVNSEAAKHMAAAALDAARAEEYLSGETEKAYASCLEDSGSGLMAERIAALDPYMRNRVVYRAITEASRGAKDISAAHVEAVLRLAERGENGAADLPSGLKAVCSYGVLRIGKISEAAPESVRSRVPAGGRDPLGIPLSADAYRMRVIPAEMLRNADGLLLPSIPRGEAAWYTKWFDYDKITKCLLRKRLPGDRITLSAEGGHKKLARVMIDAKIAPELRDLAVLPFDGREALWIPGYRISAAALVTEKTERILEISLPSASGSGNLPDQCSGDQPD